MGSRFMSDERFADLEKDLGIGESVEEPASETEEVLETQETQEQSQENQEPEPAETVEQGNQPPSDNWVLRSQFDDLMEKFNTHKAEMDELKARYKGPVEKEQPVEDTSNLDRFIEDIFGGPAPDTLDPKLINFMESMDSRIKSFEEAEKQRRIQSIRDGWDSDISEFNKVSMETDGFEVPSEFIYSMIAASNGQVHPGEAAKKLQNWAKSLTPKQKEAVEEKVKAVSRKGGTGKKGVTSSRRKTKKPRSLQEAREMAAEEWGIEL